MSEQPSPPVVELGRGVPGWVIRVLSLLLCVGSVLVVYRDVPVVLLIIVLLVLAVVAATVPASPAPAVLIAAVALVLVFTQGDPLRPAVLLEIPLLHLVHATASVAALAPLRSIVRPDALIRPALRFLAVQAGVFAVVGLTEILPTGQNTTIVEIIGLIGVTTLVLVTIRLVTREK
ncbi:MAG TPA: hypothetical protein VHV49_04885 [Pseudonocardiaceae bacterium]|jgi:hypothetical protein|nr:hypothetical protein [Pseudonocardiaceae bacterium]